MATPDPNTGLLRRSRRHKVPDVGSDLQELDVDSKLNKTSRDIGCSIFESNDNVSEGIGTAEEINFLNKHLTSLLTYERHSPVKAKSAKKTYSNKRKITNSYQVTESFCLPDEPIIAECSPKSIVKNNKLDLNALEVSETTILDVDYIEEPWKVSNLETEIISPCDEVRYKNDQEREICANRRYSEEFLIPKTPEKCNSEKVVYSPTIIKIESRKGINISVLQKNIRKVLAQAIKDSSEDRTIDADMRIEILGENTADQASQNVQSNKSESSKEDEMETSQHKNQINIKRFSRSPPKRRKNIGPLEKKQLQGAESDSDLDDIVLSNRLRRLPSPRRMQNEGQIPATVLDISTKDKSVENNNVPVLSAVRRSLRSVRNKQELLKETELSKTSSSHSNNTDISQVVTATADNSNINQSLKSDKGKSNLESEQGAIFRNESNTSELNMSNTNDNDSCRTSSKNSQVLKCSNHALKELPKIPTTIHKSLGISQIYIQDKPKTCSSSNEEKDVSYPEEDIGTDKIRKESCIKLKSFDKNQQPSETLNGIMKNRKGEIWTINYDLSKVASIETAPLLNPGIEVQRSRFRNTDLKMLRSNKNNRCDTGANISCKGPQLPNVGNVIEQCAGHDNIISSSHPERNLLNMKTDKIKYDSAETKEKEDFLNLSFNIDQDVMSSTPRRSLRKLNKLNKSTENIPSGNKTETLDNSQYSIQNDSMQTVNQISRNFRSPSPSKKNTKEVVRKKKTVYEVLSSIQDPVESVLSLPFNEKRLRSCVKPSRKLSSIIDNGRNAAVSANSEKEKSTTLLLPEMREITLRRVPSADNLKHESEHEKQYIHNKIDERRSERSDKRKLCSLPANKNIFSSPNKLNIKQTNSKEIIDFSLDETMGIEIVTNSKMSNSKKTECQSVNTSENKDVSLIFPKDKSLRIFKLSDKISNNKSHISDISDTLKSPEVKKNNLRNSDDYLNLLLSDNAKVPKRRSLRLASQEDAGPSRINISPSGTDGNINLKLNPFANENLIKLSPSKLNKIKKEVQSVSIPNRTTKRLQKLGIFVISSPDKDPNDLKLFDEECFELNTETNSRPMTGVLDTGIKAEGKSLLAKGITSEVRVILSPMEIKGEKRTSTVNGDVHMKIRPKSAPPTNQKLPFDFKVDKPKQRGRKRKKTISNIPVESQDEITHHDINVEDIKSETAEYELGNIVWAQLGKYPYWPSLVCEEPVSDEFRKTVSMKDIRTLYHVRFFGDKGRRAWVQRQQLILYCSRYDIDLIYNKIKNDTSTKTKFSSLLKHCHIQPSVSKKWQKAVDEAESIFSNNYTEKLAFFDETIKQYKESRPRRRLNSVSSTSDSDIPLSCIIDHGDDFLEDDERALTDSETVCVKRRRSKRFNSLDNSLLDDNHSPPRKKKKFTKKNKLELLDAKPNEESPSPNIVLRSLRSRKIDENSEVSSKNNSDTTSVFTYSFEAQNKLFKNNKLFKGISKEKVCQYCLKFGDVSKCKGLCGGFFHIKCGSKVVSIKRKRHKKSNINDSNSTGNSENDSVAEERKDGAYEINENFEISNEYSSANTDNENSTCENITVESEAANIQRNEETNLNREDNESLTVDDLDKYVTSEINRFKEPSPPQVEIITVPSFIFNTPPRKTFPPNFGSMSLSDQIDFKMMEIMSKFENIKEYPSGPSSPKRTSPLPHNTNISNNAIDASPSLNFSLNDVESLEGTSNLEPPLHVTADSTCFEPSISSHVEETLPKPDSKSSKKPLKQIKRSLKIKHVTADSVSFESSTNCDESRTSTEESFKCAICISDIEPHCFVCQEAVSPKGSNIRHKCSLYHCRKYYHIECLKLWPQTQWSLIQTTKHKSSETEIDSFTCPAHVCHTCASEDPRSAERCSGDKIVKCLRCPATFHSTSYCIPAGTDILTSSQVVCPRHRLSQVQPLNTTWCFICSEGGDLICCETCPTSVHPECLPINVTEDDKFICEDCESGRFPLYDEIVWVKLGNYPWWPALILFPSEIPETLKKVKHYQGDFAVKFFGTKDHCWANRSRSFLYQEGDSNEKGRKHDESFLKAVAEAAVAHRVKKEFKSRKESENISSLKPPPYIRIKVNKPVGSVRMMDLDLSNTTACDCDPNQPNPCGTESDCINRLLLTECSPEVCPAGKRCRNQSFKKREYPPVVPYKTMGRGWGLKTLVPVKKGQFVIEYVGELIDEEEYQRRIMKMDKQKEENYYFLTLTKDRMIDAGPKGNLARFMNHSCAPNCETQKWTVNGDMRVGLFALYDIPAEAELTFNYNLECVGEEKKKCMCQAPNCSGYIGAKTTKQSLIESKKPKKTFKKKKIEETEIVLPPCFICGKNQSNISCINKICTKAYHIECLDVPEIPEVNKFTCPWHHCNICSKRTIRCCVNCINSFCPPHSENNVRYDRLLGFVCNKHDPLISALSPRRRNRRNYVVTEESAVTSTTGRSSFNKGRSKSETRHKFESRLEKERLDNLESREIANESNDDNDAVSSASQKDDEEMQETPVRRKGRPRKKKQGKDSKLCRSKSVGTFLNL